MPDLLIVDDSRTARMRLKLILSRIPGAAITEAVDGKAALEVARSRTFDLLITDITMPEMTGLELIREVRKLAPWERIPILVLSVLGKEDDVDQAVARGANGYLMKPADEGTVLAAVNRHLGRTEQ